MTEPVGITCLHASRVIRNLATVITIGERIREIREKAGWSQGQLAEAVGKPQSQVSDWENGRYKKIEVDNLTRIATALSVTVLDLVTDVTGYEKFARVLGGRAKTTTTSGQEAEVVDYDITEGYKRDDIPVVAEGEASPQPNLFWDEDGLKSDIEDRISRPFDVRDPRAYGVRVRGDSMVPRYKPGEVLVVSPNSDVEDGDEVYVALLSGERLLKIARRAPGGWILESENRAHPARFVKKGEIGTMHRILWIRSSRRARGNQKGS